MYGHGCKLKRLLRQAVEAYLDEPTCALAARRAGIARSTLFRWLPLPEFRRTVDQVLAERFRLGPLPARQIPERQHTFGGGKELEAVRRVA
jgi:hypothetical protein